MSVSYSELLHMHQEVPDSTAVYTSSAFVITPAIPVVKSKNRQPTDTASQQITSYSSMIVLYSRDHKEVGMAHKIT